MAEPLRQPAIEDVLVLERAGRWAAADERYAELCREAAGVRDINLFVEALRKRARTCQPRQRYEEAEELADLSYEIASRNNLSAAAARALNILAINRYIQQDWAGASQLYTRALELAVQAGDNVQAAWAYQNLGIVANILGRLREARTLYLESICAAVCAEAPSAAMLAYNNLGMVCTDLNDWLEAEVYFARGIEVAEQIGDLPAQARLYANQAEPMIHTGEHSRAWTSLKRAERLAQQVGDLETLSDIARFRAMIARLNGNEEAADRRVNEALRIAVEHGLDLEHAEALEELAVQRHARSQPAAAIFALQRAEQLFRSLGAQRDADRVAEMEQQWEQLPRVVSP